MIKCMFDFLAYKSVKLCLVQTWLVNVDTHTWTQRLKFLQTFCKFKKLEVLFKYLE